MLVSGFWHAGFFCWPLKFCFCLRHLLHHSSTQTHFLSRPGKSQISTENAVQTTKSWVGLRNEVQVRGSLGGLQCQNTCMWSPTVSIVDISVKLTLTHKHVFRLQLATHAVHEAWCRYASYKYAGLQVRCLKECSKLWCACV